MLNEKPKKKMGLGKKILIGVAALIVVIVLANLGSGDDNNAEGATSATASKATEAVTIGQPLKTNYFEVTINRYGITRKINTGNEYTDAVAGPDNKFLVLETTFKNIDKESRMLTDGVVFINYNGQRYTFDHSESILADGYGLLLDQINPLTSKTTKLVYTLPAEIQGAAYYQPGRASKDDLILIGDVK